MAKPQQNIGVILKYLRRDRNLMQKEVCSVLNVTEQAYSNYETGRRTPDLSIIMQLAALYHVDVLLFLAMLCPDNADLSEIEIACSEEIHTPHAISQEAFILLDQYRQLPAEEQQDILLYTKIKARHYKKTSNEIRHS